MSHLLNYSEQLGRHSFFTAKEKAWHSLGVVTPDALTSAEAIKAAGLDYTVGITQNYIQVGDLFLPSTSKSTYRTDTNQILGGRLGDRYEVLQNVEAFDFFDQIVGDKLAIYETAGALGKGETVFITVKLPDYIKVMDEAVEKYIVFTMSHDGTGAIVAFFTPIRVVCNNTLNAALKNASNKISIRHTKGAKGKLIEASRVWKMASTFSPAIENTFNNMAKCRITDKKVLELLELVFPGTRDENGDSTNGKKTINIRNMVNEYIQSNDTQQTEATKGTVFGFYNGVTGYFQNVKNYKNDEKKFENIFDGTDYKTQQRAFDLCLAEL